MSIDVVVVVVPMYYYSYILLLRVHNIIYITHQYTDFSTQLMSKAAFGLIKRFTGLHGHVVLVGFFTLLFLNFFSETRIKYTYPPAADV